MQEISVFFIRGLSTKGRDDIRFAFLRWGMMHTHLQRELARRRIALYPILGMGSGLFEAQADYAVSFLREHPVWKSPGKIHLLGHSSGGLIGKKILSKLSPLEGESKIASLLTIATPHGGSHLAELCLQIPEKHPFVTWVLLKLGYDVRSGFPFYRQLTAATQAEEFKNWQAPPSVKLVSILASAPRHKWSWPFWLAQILYSMRQVPDPNDGLLEMKSQTFGQTLGPYELDHLTQLGIYRKPEFSRMCDRIAEFYRSF